MKCLVLCLVVVAALFAMTGTVEAIPITLTQISTNFTNPIGIDHHESTNTVVMSINYPSGSPNNFTRVQADGTQVAFSSVSGLTNEVKIATVRSGGIGGFTTGELFTGTGTDGVIARISPDGSTVLNPWVSLPGAGNGLMRGSLYVDRTGVYGGDLIAVTTGGEVWRVTSSGTPTKIADVGVHLEGLITVPNDPTMYGPLAGKIIAGAEGSGRLYIFDNTGFIDNPLIGVNIEDIDLITPNENFFGVNFGTARLLGAPASEFNSIVGDILLTQEFGGAPSGLFRLYYDGNSLQTEPITLNVGSANPGQWEHVTFSSAGIVEIPPVIPEPSTVLLFAIGILGIIGMGYRQRKKAI